MIALIAALAVAVGSISTWLATLPFALQMLIYVVVGVIWIAPMGPLLLWMETGKWRVGSGETLVGPEGLEPPTKPL